MTRIAAFLVVVSVLTACERAERPRPAGAVEASVRERVALENLGDTPLTDSAAIVSLAAESDGEAVALVVRDPGAGVSAALALDDARRGVQLLWPDSVNSVWWLDTAHQLAFTARTGRGTRVVVDVHAAALESIERDVPLARTSPTGDSIPAGAVALIDSMYNLRVAGRTDVLRFAPVATIAAPRSATVALYVAAVDAGGTRWNPRWIVADSAWKSVAVIDSITGPASAMPRSAAGWTDEGRFLYAKGRVVYEARVRTGASTTP